VFLPTDEDLNQLGTPVADVIQDDTTNNFDMADYHNSDIEDDDRKFKELLKEFTIPSYVYDDNRIFRNIWSSGYQPHTFGIY
jgi:hypothetical protein